jgi:hypothetical protein
MERRQGGQAERMSPIPYNGDGGYLSKDDIIKGMAAEIEMLKKELNISNQMKFTYMDDCTKMLAEYAHLKAENARLRKAGDALVFCMNLNSASSGNALRSWENAKEGKQP